MKPKPTRPLPKPQPKSQQHKQIKQQPKTQNILQGVSQGSTINVRNGVYSFITKKDGIQYAMAIKEKSEKNGAFIVLEPYTKESHQQFYVHYDSSDGCFVLLSHHSVKSIGVERKLSDPGILLIQSEISFESNYKWKIKQEGNGFKLLLKSNNNMAISLDEMTNVEDEWIF